MLRFRLWRLRATAGLFVALAAAPFGYPLVARVVLILAAGVELVLVLWWRQVLARVRLVRTAPKAQPHIQSDKREPPV